MQILILGAGRIGTQLARQLVREDKQVTVIEKDPHKAKQLTNLVDCQVINIEGNSPGALKEAGIEKADFFIAVTESDEINMITCSLVTAEFPGPVTIARVRNLDYSTAVMLERPLFGINHLVNPEIETARLIVRSIDGGVKSNVLFFDDSDLQLVELSLPVESPFVGKTIQELRSQTDGDFLVTLINRDSAYMIPQGDTLIAKGDQLFILGREQVVSRVLAKNGRRHKPIKRIAIVGGGKICRYVMNDLKLAPESHGNMFQKMITRFMAPESRQIQIVEQDYLKCKQLNEQYPTALITHADISEEGFLEEGELEGYDLLLTATGNQELNIITGVYAKKLGIPRTIALVRKNGYKKIAQELGIDVTVSLTNAVVNGIMKILRSGDIRNIHPIADSTFEIIEFALEEGAPLIGKKVQEVKLPQDSLFLMVVRGGEHILPGGDLEFMVNDRVLTIALHEDIKKIDGIITSL